MISKDGVKPDNTRVKAIKDFPVPTDATGVKSFLGLTNQLSFFIPDHIQNSKSLRELCGKGVVFNWLPEHQFEFETIKTILSANLLKTDISTPQNPSISLLTRLVIMDWVSPCVRKLRRAIYTLSLVPLSLSQILKDVILLLSWSAWLSSGQFLNVPTTSLVYQHSLW